MRPNFHIYVPCRAELENIPCEITCYEDELCDTKILRVCTL